MAQVGKLRLGIFGAARNVPFSVIEPVRSNPDLAARIDIVGVACEQGEAEHVAKAWGVPTSFGSYDELLADPTVEAVYNVLPIEMRAHWTVRALLAGKHVLSETPMSSNAREALLAQRAAEDSGRVLLEGTHPTCHPVTARVREMLVEGKIGGLERIDLTLPIGHSLHGKTICTKTGALLGLGIHGVAIVRALLGDEPRVVSASAMPSEQDAGVDEAMSISLRVPSGVEAHLDLSVKLSGANEPTTFEVLGNNGTIHVKEWFTGRGKSSNEIALETFENDGEKKVERVDIRAERDTFYFQLMVFVDEVAEQRFRGSSGLPWEYTKGKGPSDAVRNMALVDSIARVAGISSRMTTTPMPPPYNVIGRSKL